MNKPKILFPNSYRPEDVDEFRKLGKNEPVDIVEKQLKELFKIQNPGEENAQALKQFVSSFDTQNTAWVFYPWSKQLLHCLGPKELMALRTNRNKQLIEDEEQQKLAGSIVGIAGMSVGSGIALGLAYSGISREIKIADHDEVDTSNLNRLRESLINVGKSKAELAARHIYELDPFAEVHVFEEGVDAGNIDDFFTSPDLDLVVDEIDDFKMKVQLRLHAKKYKIPLIMFTNLGDNMLVDIERYDLDESQRIFNGILSSDQEHTILSKDITKEDEKRYAVQLVGSQYIPTNALRSVTQIGKSLVGRPQLYSTVAVDGGFAAYLAKNILLGKPVKAGRYFIQFDKLFDIATDEFSDNSERTQILQELLKGKQ
ncbi:MAG TPA: ThiF family adenylyltransferase [Candidatus Saccharimonadales bacterium]|nr:ThiF family adenylyltransferase [Candidatus Saccharimonadales bacterium]